MIGTIAMTYGVDPTVPKVVAEADPSGRTCTWKEADVGPLWYPMYAVPTGRLALTLKVVPVNNAL